MTQFLRLLVLAALIKTPFAWAIPIPAADFLTVDGREWVQVDLFVSLSWDDINNVCPAGVCSNATLNNYDMGGLTWASSEDVNSLLNPYLTAAGFPNSELLGPGPDLVFPNPLFDNPAATLFFADGWRPTAFDLPEQILTIGWTSTFFSSTSGNTVGYQGVVRDRLMDVFPGTDEFQTDMTWASDRTTPFEGGWFYLESVQVPTPSTLVLAGLGVLLFSFRRRMRNK